MANPPQAVLSMAQMSTCVATGHMKPAQPSRLQSRFAAGKVCERPIG